MPQICDMGQTALLPLRRKACWGFFFFALKNPTVLAEVYVSIFEKSREISGGDNTKNCESVHKLLHCNSLFRSCLLVCLHSEVLQTEVRGGGGWEEWMKSLLFWSKWCLLGASRNVTLVALREMRAAFIWNIAILGSHPYGLILCHCPSSRCWPHVALLRPDPQLWSSLISVRYDVQCLLHCVFFFYFWNLMAVTTVIMLGCDAV